VLRSEPVCVLSAPAICGVAPRTAGGRGCGSGAAQRSPARSCRCRLLDLGRRARRRWGGGGGLRSGGGPKERRVRRGLGRQRHPSRIGHRRLGFERLPALALRLHRRISLRSLVICALLNLQRAGLIYPMNAALDEPLVPRHFPQSTPLQHPQEPCEWQTRWQMSSPSPRRPVPCLLWSFLPERPVE
jgi:hypothetical protein